MEVRTLRSPGEVVPLGEAWNRLRADIDAPVLRHDWVMAGIEHLGRSDDLLVVCVFDSGQLVAAAPLSRPRRKIGRIRRLGLVGQGVHGEPGGFVYQDGPALRRLLSAIAELRLPMTLGGVLGGTEIADGLRSAGGLRVVTRVSRSSPSLEIPADADGSEALVSSSLRSDLRRARRRAGRIGPVTFAMHTPTSPEELAPLWDEVLRIESTGWKGRAGSALRHHEMLGAFFAEYARRATERKELRIGILDIGGRAAAAVVGVEWADRLWLLKIGYDERFGAVSPGMLLIEETLTHAVHRGLRSIEFLGESASWTRRWTRVEHPITVVRGYPHALVGGAAFGLDAARWLVRRFARRGTDS